MLLSAETGGIMSTPRPAPPGLDPKPAFPVIPFFGVQPCLMDAEVGVLQGRLAFLPAGHSSESRTCPPLPSQGHEIEGDGVEGSLCIKCAIPGIARGIYGTWRGTSSHTPGATSVGMMRTEAVTATTASRDVSMMSSTLRATAWVRRRWRVHW